jgi:hypothetical protein
MLPRSRRSAVVLLPCPACIRRPQPRSLAIRPSACPGSVTALRHCRRPAVAWRCNCGVAAGDRQACDLHPSLVSRRRRHSPISG